MSTDAQVTVAAVATGRGDGRQRILAAATELFVTHGYAATTTRDIAGKAGIKQPSIYKHFADKSEILIEVLSQSVRPSLARYDELAADADLSASQRLAQLVQFEIRMLWQAPWNVALLSYLPDVATGNVALTLKTQYAELRGIYGALVSDALAEAGRDPGNADALTDVVITLVEGVILRRELGPRIDGEQLARDATNAVVAMVAGPRRRR
ncbi:MAG TPA: TetR/AcrR family transcriptional regulator [Mycobacterium sp.]